VVRNCNPERIFGRVEVSESGCWLYTGGISSGGYGVVSIHNKSTQAHRVAYELRIGPIPKGLCVLHKCDIRRCINPDHLFLGTLGENNTDRERKGRSDDRRGERNPCSKLTADTVRRIRKAHATGTRPQRLIAETFGVTQSHVSAIILRQVWAWLDEEPATNGPRARRN